jgi:hypothetical protein
MESDYLLGVSDETRLGALRFRLNGGEGFLAEAPCGVPALVDLGRLLQCTDRILRDEETLFTAARLPDLFIGFPAEILVEDAVDVIAQSD